MLILHLSSMISYTIVWPICLVLYPILLLLHLTNATLPYALQLADKGWQQACIDNHPLKLGLNVVDGKVVYEGVAKAFNLPLEDVNSLL